MFFTISQESAAVNTCVQASGSSVLAQHGHQRSPAIPGMVGGRGVVLGLDCDCQPDTQEQREDGGLWSQGQSVGRAPQVHRVLTFKEQCEMAFDGLWTVECVRSGEDLWFQGREDIVR